MSAESRRLYRWIGLVSKFLQAANIDHFPIYSVKFAICNLIISARVHCSYSVERRVSAVEALDLDGHNNDFSSRIMYFLPHSGGGGLLTT